MLITPSTKYRKFFLLICANELTYSIKQITMTNTTTTQNITYNGIRINCFTKPTVTPTQPLACSPEDDTTPRPIVTTKRLSLVQEFINQVWYGFVEIKAWHKKNSVYIIDLAPVAGQRCDLIEFMRSWMEVHARFELQDQCYY